jgi:hypothetical protein
VKQSTNHLLTTAEADRLINAAAKPEFGAIEDAIETATAVTYFFEHGLRGRVCRHTGKVTIATDPVYE